MRLWVKYTGGKINQIQSNAPSGVKKGDWDKASIRIALGTWDYKKYGGDSDSPILVNTTDVSTFVDFATDESTIAFGEKIIESDESDSTNAWQQVTIPLDYHNTSKMPTHIVISLHPVCTETILPDMSEASCGWTNWNFYTNRTLCAVPLQRYCWCR